MPAVIAGGVSSAPPSPGSDPAALVFIRHPLIPVTLFNPKLTTQAAYSTVWYLLGWVVAYP